MKIRQRYREKVFDFLLNDVLEHELIAALTRAGRSQAATASKVQHGTRVTQVLDDALANDWLDELFENLAAIKRTENTRVPSTFAAVHLQVKEMLAAMSGATSFKPAALEELIDHLQESGLTDDELIAHATKAAGGREAAWRNTIELAAAIVYKLADYAERDSRHPLADFTASVKRDADRPAQKALHAWLAANCEKPPVSRSAQVGSLHLVVVVSPEGDDLRMNAWVVFEDQPNGPWPDGARSLAHNEEVTDQDLDRKVIALIPRIAAELSRAKNNLTINLFLPVRLFACAADVWQFSLRGGNSVPLGSRYHVIVRPWERTYASGWELERVEWETAWERVLNGDALRLCTREMFQNYLAEKIAGAALSFVPSETDFGDDGPFMTLVASGTPVAVWARCEPEACRTEIRQFFEELVNMHPDGWRRKIFELRETAARVGAHVGQHLALLWDNPNQRPVDAPHISELEEPPHVDY